MNVWVHGCKGERTSRSYNFNERQSLCWKVEAQAMDCSSKRTSCHEIKKDQRFLLLLCLENLYGYRFARPCNLRGVGCLRYCVVTFICLLCVISCAHCGIYDSTKQFVDTLILLSCAWWFLGCVALLLCSRVCMVDLLACVAWCWLVTGFHPWLDVSPSTLRLWY